MDLGYNGLASSRYHVSKSHLTNEGGERNGNGVDGQPHSHRLPFLEEAVVPLSLSLPRAMSQAFCSLMYLAIVASFRPTVDA